MKRLCLLLSVLGEMGTCDANARQRASPEEEVDFMMACRGKSKVHRSPKSLSSRLSFLLIISSANAHKLVKIIGRI
jgi:hypothetical protein